MKVKGRLPLIICCLVLIMSSSVFAADGIYLPLTKNAEPSKIFIKAQPEKKTGAASQVLPTEPQPVQQGLKEEKVFFEKGITKLEKKEKPEPTEPKAKPVTPEQISRQEIPLSSLILKSFKALASVLLLILIIVLLLLAYKKIREKISLKQTQEKRPKTEEEIKEPTNISEAVASFVKHRLKK